MPTLILEDGTGLTNSNSYCDLAFASQYHSDNGNADWQGTDANLTIALIQAASALDRLYGKRYISTKLIYTKQNMLWPRFPIWDRYDTIINTGDIPKYLKQAQAQAALLIYNGTITDLYPIPNNTDKIKTQDVKVDGAISTHVSYQGNLRQEQYAGWNSVEQILWPILNPINRAPNFTR